MKLSALPAAALLSLAPLAAQTLRAPDTDVVSLDPVSISEEREADYASVIGTGATRTHTPLVETPQAISVITRFQIEDQAALTLQEVLRYAPGVRAEMYGVDNRGDYFALRGGSEGSTLLDGLRLPLTGWWGSVRNEPFAFERVEVLRGPSSAMCGQNGPGGVVHLVSKRPQPTPHGELNLQVGQHAHRQAAFDLTGPVQPGSAWLYRVVGLTRDAGTQIDHAHEQRQYLAPSFTWRSGRATTLTLFAEYQKDESDNTNAFLPWTGTRLPAPLGPIPRSLFIGEPDWDTYGGERRRVGYHLEHRLNPTWTLRHALRHDDVDGHLLTMYANFWEGLRPDQRTVNRTWYAADYDHRIVNTDVLAEGRFRVGATEHTLLLGIDGYWSRHDELSAEGAATPLDVYAPVYGSLARPAPDYGPVNRTRTRQLGLTVQDQLKLDERWILVGTLRGDDARNDVAGAPEAGSDDRALTSRLGIVFRGGRGWSPYASYAESFETVGGTDAAGRGYQPKRGEQFELGVKWAPRDGRIAAAAAAYHLVEQNRLTSDPSEPLNSIQGGEVTVRGLELESTATFATVSFLAHYTYTDARTTASSDPADPYLHHRLVSIPEHSAAVWAVHAFRSSGLQGLRAGFGVRYVGESWDGTDSPVTRTPSHTLCDALLAYARGHWHYALNASNVFDRSYVATSLDRGDTWFGSRRKVIGTVSYRW